MSALTPELLGELSATARTNDALKGPTFVMRFHYATLSPLIRRGLLTWGDPPDGFSKKRFAGVCVTADGRDLLQQFQDALS